MDYNYIRMRNAIKAGNDELAAQYRKLYESGKDIKATSHIIDYVLVLLIVIAIALGVYSICYSHSIQNIAPQTTEISPAPADGAEPTENSEV